MSHKLLTKRLGLRAQKPFEIQRLVESGVDCPKKVRTANRGCVVRTTVH